MSGKPARRRRPSWTIQNECATRSCQHSRKISLSCVRAWKQDLFPSSSILRRRHRANERCPKSLARVNAVLVALFSIQARGRTMRVAIIGQQEFGEAALNAFLARGDEVAGVFCAPEKPGSRPDPLRIAAEEKRLRLYQFPSYSTAEPQDALRDLNADIAIMAYVLIFAPRSFINIPKYGTIQFHPSLLPLHRGPSSINWPIMLGHTKTGLTIFRPNDGLDEGPILLQKEVEIGPDDTLGSVYFDKIFPLGVEALLAGAGPLLQGKGPEGAPDEKPATQQDFRRV